MRGNQNAKIRIGSTSTASVQCLQCLLMYVSCLVFIVMEVRSVPMFSSVGFIGGFIPRHTLFAWCVFAYARDRSRVTDISCFIFHFLLFSCVPFVTQRTQFNSFISLRLAECCDCGDSMFHAHFDSLQIRLNSLEQIEHNINIGHIDTAYLARMTHGERAQYAVTANPSVSVLDYEKENNNNLSLNNNTPC